MSARQQPDDPGSLPWSVLDLAARIAGFGFRTTVGVATTAARLGARRTAAALDDAFTEALTAVVDRIPVQQLLDRVDLNAVLARMDVNEIIDRVDIDGIMLHIDIDAIVDRLDIDAILDRVDLNAVVGRVDTVGIAAQVIDGVDLPGIIRDSTGTMATETVGGLRLQTLHADDLVSQLIDRIIRRNGRQQAAIALPADVGDESGH